MIDIYLAGGVALTSTIVAYLVAYREGFGEGYRQGVMDGVYAYHDYASKETDNDKA